MSAISSQLGSAPQGGFVNPELDQTQKSIQETLKQLKNETTAENVAAGLKQRGIIGLRIDLKELKIDRSKWGQYERMFAEKFMAKTANLEKQAIFESFEAKNLTTFLDEYAQYSELDVLIEQCRKEGSSASLEAFFVELKKKSPLMGGIAFALVGALRSEKPAEEKGGFAKAIDRIYAVLSGTFFGESEEEAVETQPKKPKGKASAPQKVANKQKEQPPKKKTPPAKPILASYTPPEAQTATPKKRAKLKTDLEDVTWKTSRGSPKKYAPIVRKPEALSGTAFMERYMQLESIEERHMLVLEQLKLGNVPEHFKTFETIRVTGVRGTVVEFDVARTGLRIGTDNDYFDVPLDGPTAQAAAEMYGCTLATPFVSKAVHTEAKKTGGMVPFIAAPEIAKALGIKWDADHPDGNKMKSAAFVKKRNELLKKRGMPTDRLISGYFKDITPSSKPGRLEIYGGYRKDGTIVQNFSGGFHVDYYHDYSHQPRFARNLRVNGQPMSFDQFHSTPKYMTEFLLYRLPVSSSYRYSKRLQAFLGKSPSNLQA